MEDNEISTKDGLWKFLEQLEKNITDHKHTSLKSMEKLGKKQLKSNWEIDKPYLWFRTVLGKGYTLGKDCKGYSTENVDKLHIVLCDKAYGYMALFTNEYKYICHSSDGELRYKALYITRNFNDILHTESVKPANPINTMMEKFSRLNINDLLSQAK